MNLAKFLRTPFFIELLRWRLLLFAGKEHMNRSARNKIGCSDVCVKYTALKISESFQKTSAVELLASEVAVFRLGNPLWVLV